MRRVVVACAALFVVAPSPAAAGAAGGGGCHEATEGTGTVVELAGACFTPSVLRVGPGTTIEFVNHDQMVHVVAGIGWGSADLAPGDRTSHRFDQPGTYAYSCYLHPTMNGAVVVGDGVGAGPVVELGSAATTTPTTSVAARATNDDEDGSTAPVAAGVGLGGVAVGFLMAKSGGRLLRRP